VRVWAMVFVAVCATAACPRRAHAEVDGPDWAFGEPAGEVAVGVVSVLSLGSMFLPQSRWPWGPSGARPHHATGSRASDIVGASVGSLLAIGAGWVLESLYYVEGDVDVPFARATRTTLVEAEALALTTGITVAMKRLSGRCRPRALVDGRCLDSDSAHTAFPSGHTSAVGSVAGVRLWMVSQSEGTPALRVGSFAIAESLTVAAAVLRVVAGAHSWEDVLAGYFVGHATGVVVAAVHPFESVAPVATPGGVASADPAQSTSATPVISWGGGW